jgi:prephenate dehydrogenase
MNTSWQELVKSYVAGHALPRALYQGDVLYEAEIRTIFLRSWLCVGHHSQAPRTGDYFLFEMAGESVIVIRGQDGNINALLNVCRHRGSRICDQPSGHESRLVCRYHGWTYGLDGRLVGTRVRDGGMVRDAAGRTLLRRAVERAGAETGRRTVTDAGSTKVEICRVAAECLPAKVQFVGGHPMAGSELSGVSAARADLFDGAYWLLTPSADTDPEAFSAMHALVTGIGARVISVDAAAHDEAVAIVSHVPHVTAAALVDLAAAHSGERGELMRLAAGGFKDTTRIAAGSADLWTGICLDNAVALSEGIEELRERLEGFETVLRARDAEAIRAWLDRAAEVRRSLPAQWVPATAQLTELAVPMLDRTGQVAEITGATSRAGCNIEAIDIDHQSESSAVLVLVLTDEGDFAALMADLAERGYEPVLRPLEEAGDE